MSDDGRLARPDGEPHAPPDEPHEVTAMYDNLGGLSLGLTYGTPVLDCSCGYSTPTLETWAEVGEHYDRHLADEGLRDG